MKLLWSQLSKTKLLVKASENKRTLFSSVNPIQANVDFGVNGIGSKLDIGWADFFDPETSKIATPMFWFPGRGSARWTATAKYGPWPDIATTGPGREITWRWNPPTVKRRRLRRSVAAATLQHFDKWAFDVLQIFEKRYRFASEITFNYYCMHFLLLSNYL